MTRLTDDQLKIARALEDCDTLWLAADPLLKFAMSELRCGDEDALQEARLAVGAAVRSWDPLKGAFSTHVATYARQAILDWMGAQRMHGIGSRDSIPATVMSLNDPSEAPWHEEDSDDRATHLDHLTYEDVDDSTEFEQLMRSGELQNQADQLLRFIPEEDAQFFRAVAKAGGTRAFGRATGLTHQHVSERLAKIMAKLSRHLGKTCYNQSTRLDLGQHRNGRFYIRESAGNPWADWAYKPTAEDIAAGAAPRDDVFQWSDGARKLGVKRRKRK